MATVILYRYQYECRRLFFNDVSVANAQRVSKLVAKSLTGQRHVTYQNLVVTAGPIALLVRYDRGMTTISLIDASAGLKRPLNTVRRPLEIRSNQKQMEAMVDMHRQFASCARQTACVSAYKLFLQHVVACLP